MRFLLTGVFISLNSVIGFHLIAPTFFLALRTTRLVFLLLLGTRLSMLSDRKR